MICAEILIKHVCKFSIGTPVGWVKSEMPMLAFFTVTSICVNFCNFQILFAVNNGRYRSQKDYLCWRIG